MAKWNSWKLCVWNDVGLITKVFGCQSLVHLNMGPLKWTLKYLTETTRRMHRSSDLKYIHLLGYLNLIQLLVVQNINCIKTHYQPASGCLMQLCK